MVSLAGAHKLTRDYADFRPQQRKKGTTGSVWEYCETVVRALV